MKTKTCFLVFAVVLLLTACSTPEETPIEKPQEVTEKETKAEPDKKNGQLEEKLSGLTKDLYPDMTVTAAVLERKAILPGAAIPLTITVENKGDKKIVYSQGSGSFSTPQALILDIPDLQAVLPKDHLGVATMDIRTKELHPGETLKYTLYIMAVEPNENFDNYTYDRWNSDETYLPDLEWNELQKAHSDLKAITAGSYQGDVYFLYDIMTDESENQTLGTATYTQSSFTLTVSE